MPTLPQGRVFDGQRFCTQDGPGIRTTIFFKGCPLRCAWCSNPESQTAEPQLMFHEHLCRACGRCAEVCPHGATTRNEGHLSFHRERCAGCGACARVCPHEARILSGRTVDVDKVVDFVRQDWRYYQQSGGGVTCSGGEALAQPDFLRELLTRLHDGLGYHTCLDTTAFAPWETLASVLPVTDLVLLDIKHMDGAEHKRMTGVDNTLILDNARRLGEAGFPTLIRVPLIPGFNDMPDNIRALGIFLTACRFHDVELMPYHTLGQSKYQALGRGHAPIAGTPDADGSARTLRNFGLNVLVHGA